MYSLFNVVKSLLLPLTLAALAAGAGQVNSKPPKTSALDKATLEAYVRHLFVWGPQIQVTVGDPKPSELPGFYEVTAYAAAGEARIEQRFFVSKDGRKIVQGAVYDIKQNPFQAVIEKLKTESQPMMGAAGSPVVLVLFSDFQCPYCKQEAEMLRGNLVRSYPKQVRLYFKDFPLEPIHPWAKPAAIAGRCIFRQNADAFWQYHDWVYDHQSEFTPQNFTSKVMEFAQNKPIDVLQLNRCLDARATEAEVNQSIAEARSLGLNSTPTLFVNGRRLAAQVSWAQLRGIIDYEIEYMKTAMNTSPDCGAKDTGCEVTLASPLAK